MTVIKVKNSNVGGRVPAAGDLQPAELALNLQDKKLYSKDVSGQVFEIGVAGDVPTGDTPPSSGNNNGDLFFDTGSNELKYWSGTAWETVTVEPADGEGYVKGSGDNMTGDLTLGTDKITLDATDGSAEFTGEIIVNGTGSADSAFYISEQGFMNVNRKDASGTNASLCVNQGGTEVVLAGKNSQAVGAPFTSQINADGSAAFNGNVDVGDDVSSATNYNKNGILLTSDGDAVLCNSEATTDVATALTLANRQTALTDGQNTQIEFQLVNSGGAVSNAYIRATASDAIGTGGSVIDIGNRRDAGAVTATALQIDEFQRVRLVSTLTNTSAGSLYLENPGASFSIFGTGGSQADPKILMSPNGSAQFASSVTSNLLLKTDLTDTTIDNQAENHVLSLVKAQNGKNPLIGDFYLQRYSTEGSVSSRSGLILKLRDTGSGSSGNTGEFIFEGGGSFKTRTPAGDVNVEINASGNATFGGSISNQVDDASSQASVVSHRGFISGAVQGTMVYKTAGNLELRAGATDVKISLDGTTGNATFDGNITAGNVSFNLEPDNDANYTTTTEEYEEQELDKPYVPAVDPVVGPRGNVITEGVPAQEATYKTVTKTREVKTYSGPTLDVKDELQSLRARATQQDEVIAMMTAALRDLGADVSKFPAPAKATKKK